MAKIQGYLLKYKNDSKSAIESLYTLSNKQQEYNPSKVNSNQIKNSDLKSNNKSMNSTKGRIRTLSPLEIDRMYFNPQPGWDEGLKELK